MRCRTVDEVVILSGQRGIIDINVKAAVITRLVVATLNHVGGRAVLQGNIFGTTIISLNKRPAHVGAVHGQ